MAKIKYDVVYKRIEKKDNHVIQSNCREVVEAESETNAIAAVKKRHTIGSENCEIVSVTPKN